MRTVKLAKLPAVFLLFIYLASLALAGDVNYPYGRIELNLPPLDDPFPGFGAYYSTIAKGMRSILWNPAALGKLKLSEAAYFKSSAAGFLNNSVTTKYTESGGTLKISDADMGQYGLFLRSPAAISGVSTKEVGIDSNLSYQTVVSGANYSSALKVNDWLSVGFATGSPIGGRFNLSGDFPLTAKAVTQFAGQNINQMQIGADGKIRYTFSSGSLITTYESTQPLWTGFLTQEALIPLTTLTELRNDANFETPYVGALASNFGGLSAGLSFMPINASANIDNDIRAVINSDTKDIFLYTPNFDSSNQTDLANWINDPDRYGTVAGYQRKQIKMHAGDILIDSRYRGFYSASTARTDLGIMYDATDWLTFGYALENFGSAALNFKGSGLAYYINYRNIDTAEAASTNDLFKPGGKTTINLLTDRWVTTTEAGGTSLFLEPEKNVPLPKKTRLGIALKRPFLIAIDYEQNQNPISLSGSPETIISNLNFLRLGLESQLLVLPFWTRLGLTLALKPTISGGSSSTTDSLNSFFRYGVLPLRLDLGSTLNLWGLEITDSFGFDALPLIGLLQFDTQNLDLSRLLFLNLFVKKDAWEVAYLQRLDALSTVTAYGNKPADASGQKKFEVADAKFIQTLGITYRF